MYLGTRKYYFLFLLLLFVVPNTIAYNSDPRTHQDAPIIFQASHYVTTYITVIDAPITHKSFIYCQRQIKQSRKIGSSSKILSKNEAALYETIFIHTFLKVQPKTKYIDQSNHCCFLI